VGISVPLDAPFAFPSTLFFPSPIGHTSLRRSARTAAESNQEMDGGGGVGRLRWTAEEASTIGGIATVSLLHSFIPTHWLPFSIVARAQRWSLSRTLLVSQYPAASPASPNASFSSLAAIAACCCPPVLDLRWTVGKGKC
jgi:hypothetical protein